MIGSALKYAGYFVIAASVLLVLAALGDGRVAMFAQAVSLFVAGLLLIAFSDLLGYLRDIRDTLIATPEAEKVAGPQGTSDTSSDTPTTSLADLDARIQAAKKS